MRGNASLFPNMHVNTTANTEHRPLFDLNSDEDAGLNESERILGRLCRYAVARSFVFGFNQTSFRMKVCAMARDMGWSFAMP